MLDLVAGLRAELGTSVLFISHNLAVVRRMCDRVGVLCRPARGGGPGRRDLPRPTASLHGRAPPLPSAQRHRQAGTAARHHPWAPSRARRRALRLRLRRPLRACPCRLPGGGAAAASPSRGAREPVPLLGGGARPPAHRRSPASRRSDPAPTAGRRWSRSPLRPRPSTRTVTRSGARGRHARGRARRDPRAGRRVRKRQDDAGARPSRPHGSGRGNDSGARRRHSPAGLADRDTEDVQAIQIVFQNPDSALNRRFSARRILARALTKLLGLRGERRDARVRELAEAVPLRRATARRPSRAALRRPEAARRHRARVRRRSAGVVCDEPTSALDVSVQAAILNLLVDLQNQQGVSYLFISHDASASSATLPTGSPFSISAA